MTLTHYYSTRFKLLLIFIREKQRRGILSLDAWVELHWANENPCDGFSTLAITAHQSWFRPPPERLRCGWSSPLVIRTSTSWEPAGDQDWVSAAGQPIFQLSWRREGPHCALQSLSSPRGHSFPYRMPAQHLPKGPGNHVDANKTSNPPGPQPQQEGSTSRYSPEPLLAANLKLPTRSSDLNHAPWSVTNCWLEQKQWFWLLIDFTIFFPEKLQHLFSWEGMKHENRPIVQLFWFQPNALYAT